MDIKKGISSRVLSNWLPVFVVAIGTLLLGMFLQREQAFMYFYRESQQLLFLERDYIAELVLQFGGGGIFLSQWLVQFFVHAGMGATITALLAGGTVWMLWLAMRKVSEQVALLPLLFVPVLMQMIYLITSYHLYTGLVAMFMMALTLWCYTLYRGDDWRVRMAIGVVLALCLYLLFGSVAMLFAVCVLLYDAMLGRQRWYLDVIYLGVLLVAGSYMVANGEIAGYDVAYGVKHYNEFYVEITPFHSFAWVSVVVVMLLFYAMGKIKLPKWSGALVFVLATCFAAGFYIQRHDKEKNDDLYAYMSLFHYMVTEQWDKITGNRNINLASQLNMNCVNFALSKQGRLLDDLFLYPQSADGLTLMKDVGTFVEEHTIFSEIYYHLGIVSQTLELSLAAMAGTYPGTPWILKQFIESRIVLGDYNLAEKMVRRLENTHAYRDWAMAQRKFLHDDAAVEADAEYGAKRRGLPELSSEFVSVQGFMYDLIKILEADPSNEVAREYAIAHILLVKDFDSIRYFVENYYNTDMLPSLPVRLQEAVVTYSERDMDYCRRYGVSEEVIYRFAQFRQKVLAMRHQQPNVNPKSQLSEFRNTFWYYMLN